MFHKDREKFSFDYESSASSSYLVLRMDTGRELFDYQIEMIANNPNAAILPLEIRHINDKINLYYNITSKITLTHFLSRKKLDRNEFAGLMRGIIKAVSESSRYFLNENSFVIDENYIFVNPATTEISLVYIPLKTEEEINNSFKAFVSNLMMNVVNFDEDSGGSIIQKTSSCLRQEHFNLAGLDKLLLELSNLPTAPMPVPSAGAGTEIEKKAPQKPAESMPPEEKMITKKACKKDNVLVAVLAQVFVCIIIGLVVQILPDLDKDDRISAIGGVVIVLGAVDFLLVRKLLGKKDRIEISAAEKSGKHNKAAAKIPESKESKKMNLSKREIYNKTLDNYQDRREKAYADIPVNIPAASSSDATEVFVGQSSLDTVMLGDGTGVKRIAYLKSTRGDLVEKIILSKPSFIIGRLKEQVDYVSQNGAVGKIHAELISRDRRYFVKDLNSKNGTKINGARINSNIDHEIKCNDRVAFANSEYLFICEPFEG